MSDHFYFNPNVNDELDSDLNPELWKGYGLELGFVKKGYGLELGFVKKGLGLEPGITKKDLDSNLDLDEKISLLEET